MLFCASCGFATSSLFLEKCANFAQCSVPIDNPNHTCYLSARMLDNRTPLSDVGSLLETYSKQLASQGSNRVQLLRHAKDFLDYLEASGGDITRENIQKYLDRLRKRTNYSDGTMDIIFRCLKRVFEVNRLEWPFRLGDGPQIREDSINRPALSPETIIELIQAVKTGSNHQIRAFMAIATTYGTRRSEIIELTQQDVNLKDAVIHISTKKHGRDRMHVIPEVIIPYLKAYDFNERISPFSLLMLWYRLEHQIEMKRIERVGFHAIRRTLDTLLLRELDAATVKSFLRWKQATSSDMAYRYSAQRFVGKDGVETKVVGGALDVDSRVFKVHPFLDAWR